MRILGAAVAVILLAGCAPTPVVEPVETTNPPVIETVEIPDPPAQVFGGSCADVLHPAALGEALGGTWPAGFAPERTLDPTSQLVPNAGGIQCWWGSDDNQGLSATIIPADAVSAPEDTSCGFETDQGPASCAVDVTANGMRLAGLYTASSGDVATLSATVASIEALFATTAADATAVSARTLDPTAWPSAPDCPSLEVSGATVDDEVLGTDVFFPPAVAALSGGSALALCSVSTDRLTFDLSFSVLGDGRWAETAVRAAPDAEVLDVDGLELVILIPDSGSVNVFDGVNWLHAWMQDDDDFYPILAEVVAALNKA